MRTLAVFKPTKFGRAAVRAAELLATHSAPSPEVAWNQAVAEVFPGSPSCRKKGCPKGAFLGLCEEGLVLEVPSGDYTNSEDNKRYAVDAANALKEDGSLAGDQKAKSVLWARVTENGSKVHNSQMDVVLALWHSKLIRR